MAGTPLISLLSILAASFLGAAGQYLFKAGAGRTQGVGSFLLSPWILSGMACYVAVMVLFTFAFRRGGEVTVLYPVYASTFVWAAVMGIWIEGNPIRPVHVAGMILLIGGMWLMGLGNASPGNLTGK